MTMHLSNPGLRFYQSANADEQTIKDDFLIRIHEFNIIIDDVRRNPMKGSVQHYLLLGRRGSGKSTLLKRIQVEIDSDEQLKTTHVAINLAEEQANIYRLFDLLIEIIDELEEKGIVVSRPAEDDDSNSYIRSLFASIHKAITQSGKKVVLLLDNIDRIFENLREDSSMMREMLLNFDDIKIIGGSTKMTEHFWSHDQPFYQFFRVLELKQLSSDEIKLLLNSWSTKLNLPQLAEFVTQRAGQLETVRILTDGLPRTLQFFVNILINHTHETGYEYLKQIMDQVTPLYQERLNNLPPAQRRIVLQMAFLWEAAGTKDIAAAASMESSIISAQLKQLTEKEITEKIETGTKNHLYRLSERFFNLWLIFTQGSPKEKRKAKCLTIFMENFYDADGLRGLAQNHLLMLQRNEIGFNNAALLTKALAQSKYINSMMRDLLIEQTMQLESIETDLKTQLPPTIANIQRKIEELIANKDWSRARKMAESIEQEDGIKEAMLGEIYLACNHLAEATESYQAAVGKGAKYAMNNLGLSYEKQGNFLMAEHCLLEAVKNGETKSIFNLALLYERQHKTQLAEQYFIKAIEVGDFEVLNNLGGMYVKEKQFERAKMCFLEAIKKGSKSAVFNVAVYFAEQGKIAEAEKYYIEALDMGIKGAAYNLGYLYSGQGNYELAEKYYLTAIGKGEDRALLNIGVLYDNWGKNSLSQKYYRDAIEKGEKNALCPLAISFYKSGIHREETLSLIIKAKNERFEEAGKLESLAHISITVLAWNGFFKEASSELQTLLNQRKFNGLEIVFRHLLIHHQTNLILNLFQNPDFGQEIIERFQPIYYAVRVLAGRELNIELKIPPEIKGTVDNILANVKEKQEFYYGAKKG